MGNKVKLKLNDIEKMYPYFCPKMQTYFNSLLKKINPLDDYIEIEQDLIDYSYLVGGPSSSLVLFFSKIAPKSKNVGFFKKIYILTKLYFKYFNLFKKYVDPTLLREGEKMVMYRTGLCQCKNDIFKKEKDRMVSINDPNKIITEDQYSKIKGIKLKTKESIG